MGLISPLKVIHVDDDPGFISHFKKLLDTIPDIAYVQSFDSALEVLKYLETGTADLIFMDIEMPDHDGMWLAKKIVDRQINIVFVTSHTKYAIQAFEVCALDYIQKPPDMNRLKGIIERLQYVQPKLLNGQAEQISAIYSYLMPAEKPNRIFLNMTGHVSVIKLDEVIYFNSINNYTAVIIHNAEKQIASKTIKTFEQALSRHPDFLRVSRSSIINKNYIRTIQRNAKSRRITVSMENGDVLETSFKTKEEIMERLIH